MLQLRDKFTFGKHKGNILYAVLHDHPEYMSWMKQTGFSDFGKEVTLAIDEWEAANPHEVSKIQKSIERKKLRESIGKTKSVTSDESDILKAAFTKSAPVIERPVSWGSW